MKLPKPIKRGHTWRITVTYDKKRYSATRDTEKECEQWAAIKLLELKTGKAQEEKGVKPALPFNQLCEKYYLEKGIKLKSKDTIRTKFNNLQKILGDLATKSVYDFVPLDIAKWKAKRLKEVKTGTVAREHAIFCSVISYAQRELFLIDSNVWFSVKSAPQGKPRNQRISDEQIALVIKNSKWDCISSPKTGRHYAAWMFLFALETAMRRGEIFRIKPQDIRDGFIHIPITKNDEPRNVPLSKEASRLLSLLEPKNNCLVPVSLSTFKDAWASIKNESNINHIRFHDTRHEAITRMVRNRKLPVEVLAKITGHKTINILINTYYNPNAQDLVEMFNGSES